MDNLTFYQLALKHGSKINPFGALCQCNWETRTNGRPWESELFQRANNAAGIKAGASWQGSIYEKISWEQLPDGTKYEKKSAFRKYASADEFLADYADKISATYPNCALDNFWGYFSGLYKGKYGAWATDLKYFEKLCMVAIKLAPEIFGPGYKDKLVAAYKHASGRGYLSAPQKKCIYELLGLENDDSVPPVDTTPKKRIICLDAGHGGWDPGATYPHGSPTPQYKEKDITLKIVLETGKLLGQMGYEVFYTRVTDESISRPERARVANNNKADFFLSIHVNSALSGKGVGHENYVSTSAGGETTRFAGNINRHWVRVFPKMPQRGTKIKDYDVLVLTKMPAVLDEIGFLSNDADRKVIVDPQSWRLIASIYANAINDTLNGR